MCRGYIWTCVCGGVIYEYNTCVSIILEKHTWGLAEMDWNWYNTFIYILPLAWAYNNRWLIQMHQESHHTTGGVNERGNWTFQSAIHKQKNVPKPPGEWVMCKGAKSYNKRRDVLSINNSCRRVLCIFVLHDRLTRERKWEGGGRGDG